MTRSEHIRALLEEYAAQRARNDAELNARVEAAERRDPEIARLRADSVSLALGTMRTILSLPTQEARVEAAQRMRARGQANNAEIRRRLKALGLPEDDLELKYRCPVCKDTGYVGDAPARFCECFETRLRARRHEDGSMAGTDEQNFERFDLNRFPEEGGQRAQMALARRLCEEYADRFPETRYRNLLLTGAGGLGKTYLLNCKDDAYQAGTAKMEVTGGTFYGFDPANNTAEGANTNFVKVGYASTANDDGSYTVDEVKANP